MIQDKGRVLPGLCYFYSVKFQPDDINLFKKRALHWAASFDVACYMDSNNFADNYGKFNALIAAGVKYDICTNSGNAFRSLADFKAAHRQWMTGFFGYDLKNEVEQLASNNQDHLNFPDLYFFVPKHLIIIKGDEVELNSADAESIYKEIGQVNISTPVSINKPKIKTRFSKAEYIDTVSRIKQYINRGDIYVTNFCQEFYADDTAIDPVDVYQKLNKVSPNPFSCFFKYHEKYILCASPERFLAKNGNKLISQPIKGTAKRAFDTGIDEHIKHTLKNSIKERQENVMIVDLVRNDLTRSAKPGTVKVEELYGIYSFKHLHQMISTVVCDLNDDVSAVQAISNSFPMGSMTGAPKVSAMRLMEQYERTKRGIYSGAVGYFNSAGDFDFNVVIRSVLYNAKSKYLSFQAGSAITHNADAAFEYEECLLKVKAILEVLSAQVSSPQP